MPDPSIRDRVKTDQKKYLKNIREREKVNLLRFQEAIREMIICNTKGKKRRTQVSIARALGLSESII